MSAACVRGVLGHVKWHYYTAAAVAAFTVTRTGTQWDVSGTVTEKDAFKLAQRPLMFVAPWAIKATATAPARAGQWTWPIVSFAIADNGRFTARLAAPLDFGMPAGVATR